MAYEDNIENIYGIMNCSLEDIIFTRKQFNEVVEMSYKRSERTRHH